MGENTTENIPKLQTRISDSLLMDSETKEHLNNVVKDPSVAKLVEEYLDIYTPFEVSVLEAIHPKLEQQIRQGEKWMETMERKKEQQEASTLSLEYV